MATRPVLYGYVGWVPDPCTVCGKPTACGSGNWVNRIPSQGFGAVAVDGWMCAECDEHISDPNYDRDTLRNEEDYDGRGLA